MNKANECSCPSGDGSLVHPCPAHPAVEQAGGDERDFQAEGAQEVPSPVSQEYDRHLISLLRKGEALPGHQEEAADEIERLRDWNDHLNNTVLPNILNPTFLMLMKGGERLLDLCTKDGKFIGVSLNDMKDVFDWMVTHARIAPDHAALAQPSPVRSSLLINGYQLRAALEFIAPDGTAKQLESEARIEWRQQDADFLEAGLYAWCAEYPEEGCVLLDEEPATAQPSPAQAEQAEAERPEAVAWQYRVTAGPQTGWSLWHPGKGEEFERSYTVERRPLMTVAQYDRIVGELRAVIAQLRQHKNDYMDSGQETYRALQNEIREREAEIARLDGLVSGRTAERDAALARVAGLENGTVYVEARQCYECHHGGINDSADGLAACHDCDWTGPEPDEDKCPGCHRENCMAAACPECGGRYELVADANIAAPPAQAQHLHDLDKQCRDDVARALGLRPNEERGFAWSYLLASIKSCVKASEDTAQAQHSVPEVSGIGRDFAYPRSVVLYLRTEPTDDDLRAIHDGLLSLAAAPGKEVGHE
ncbi:hypothetical protein [Pseudomonas aeruginosa]|uniref:hypothetical protein n=1 Tax=Pseudomonas aeruginosa TaxID=287 RepID=UPI000709F849|nr:hypothetical protein [Pseudomonas aeruginosa]